MSDQFDNLDDDFDDEIDDSFEQETPLIKKLRKEAKQAAKAKAEAAERSQEAERLRRELAFERAGIKTDTKLGSMLFKTYEGELTAEQIRAFASEVGYGASEAQGDSLLADQAADLSDTVAQITDQATTPLVDQPDATEQWVTDYEAARKKGLRRPDAFAEAQRLTRSRMSNTPTRK